MQPFANALADAEAVQAVTTYLAALPPVPQPGPAAGDARRGASLYNGNCGACHGGAAEGNAALGAPRLAGLDSAYLRRQFNRFRDGLRGAAPSDRLGRQMAMMASTLPDDAAIDDVLAHIAGLGAADTESQP
jgi:cytochrome c553